MQARIGWSKDCRRYAPDPTDRQAAAGIWEKGRTQFEDPTHPSLRFVYKHWKEQQEHQHKHLGGFNVHTPIADHVATKQVGAYQGGQHIESVVLRVGVATTEKVAHHAHHDIQQQQRLHAAELDLWQLVADQHEQHGQDRRLHEVGVRQTRNIDPESGGHDQEKRDPYLQEGLFQPALPEHADRNQHGDKDDIAGHQQIRPLTRFDERRGFPKNG